MARDYHMNPGSLTLLAFAFATSDVLLEIDTTGEVTTALGAVAQLAPEPLPEEWLGVFRREDTLTLRSAFRTLRDGQRAGPYAVVSASGKSCLVSLCRLPSNGGRVACVIAFAPPPDLSGSGEFGLLNADEFRVAFEKLMASGEVHQGHTEISVVQIPGFDNLAAQPQAEISAAIRAEAVFGVGAARLGADTFGVIRSRNNGGETLEARLNSELKTFGTQARSLGQVRRDDKSSSSSHQLRALQLALRDMAADDVPTAGFFAVLETRMKTTVQVAERLAARLREERFSLEFQPIVDLTSRRIHHFEALLRLSGEDTFAAVRAAEAMDMAPDLDLGVVRSVIRRLRQEPPSILVAVNLSAATLGSAGAHDAILGALDGAKDLSQRLLIEITESETLKDLDQANRRIQDFRQRGHSVYLDDFGAGAASISYLQMLEVDGVKIDGRYIRDITKSNRDRTLVKHIVRLCADFGTRCVAEVVETEEVHAVLVEAGVTYGQGWLYGRPSAVMLSAATNAGSVPRRRGLLDEWR
ncbi:EAL domain-containing protein [Brevundimonas sp.]|uniref:EAL domain-containing protein n=1 Tax=Brevundimonas sp. TaxID=1871086 RepID=UPI0025FDE1E9|nr:EAL domain-containing protein [Brevundimonas sp.]